MTAETIYSGEMPITAEVDRTDPGNPCIRLECGCNEFWLNADEAVAVLGYLQRAVPALHASAEKDCLRLCPHCGRTDQHEHQGLMYPTPANNF